MPKKSPARFASSNLSSPAVLEALEPRLLLSLIAHLELNETSGTTAVDTVGNHDGTLYSDATWDDGRIDNGVYFDGSGGYIDVANSEDFNFDATDSFTISTWVRDDDSGYYASAVSRGGTSAVGLGISTNANGPGWFIGKYANFDGGFTFSLSDGTNGTYGSYSPALADGYHLLTMVVDRSTNQMRCYVDATLFATLNISTIGSLDGGSDVMQIGGSTTWNGMVDDVRVYDNALSTGDVEDLYEDAPTWVSIHADDAIASEDAPTTDGATFRVLRTGSLSGAITVNYSVSGTASSGDYSETLGGTVTIGDGESYVDVTVTPIDDATADDGETLTLTLNSGTGYVVSGYGSGTAAIYDEAGLLAYWELDETSGSTAADSTGNGFTGTLYGNTTWTDGRIGNGAEFDGSSDYIAVDGAGIDFGGDQSFTISAWTQDDGALRTAAVSKGHSRAQYGVGAEGAGWGMGRYLSGQIAFGVNDGSNSVYYSTGSYPSGSTFHLMTMVVDRDTQYMYCYIDGQLKNQLDISSVGSLASFDESLYISTGTWNGIIDDVRVYTYALDSTAVENIYNSAFPSVQITATDAAAYENSGDPAVFRVYRDGTDGDLVVNYSVSGTASSADYSETLSGTVTIADGNSYVDITITPVSDAADNGETLTLTLASGTEYAIGEDDEATITIYDSDYLLAHWALDETSGTTAYDSVNDYDGTLINGAVWDDGRIDNGIYLDGSNDRIDVTDANDFDFGASTSFTVSAWVRDDTTHSRYPTAVSRGSTLAGWSNYLGAGWAMGGHEEYTPGYIYFGITDGTNMADYVTSHMYNTDYFHLVTMVVDRSAAMMYCYIDGELDGSTDISSVGSISSPDEPLQIGAGYNTLQGVVDDVRIYGAALSANDVAALYNSAPAGVAIYADDAIANEDAVGTDAATFHVIRTGSDNGAIVVNYSISGTASSGDYSETLSGTITMADGQRDAEIVVTPVDDGTADSGETLTLTLASGTGYVVLGLDEATAVIYDEAGLLAHWEMDETSGATAADSTGNGFTGTRSGDTVWTDGRIDNGAYFDGTGDTMVIANAESIDFGGDQSFTVSAWVRDDGGTYNSIVSKGNDWAQMGNTNDGAGWSIGNGVQNKFGVGITDGTTVVSCLMGTWDDACDSGPHLVTMTVDRGAQQLRCYIDGVLFDAADISAVGSLASFDEPLLISSSGALWTGMVDDVRIYTYALNSMEVAALYAEAPPMVIVETIDTVASETGSEPAAFRVTRDGDTSEALEVDYTVTGTASSGDYSETLSGTVTIAAGESYAYLTVTPVDDATNEGDETVVVTLMQTGTDYTLFTPAAATATVTIGDSDNVADPQVVIAAIDSVGSEDGNETATYRIYRSGATTSDLAVNYSVSGTADSGDYSETLSGTVTIASGNSYADITITPITDENFEYPETVTLTLTADAGYSVGLADDATATILDVPFSAQLNPTGDPIGGGENYSDIIDIGDADYVVDTAQELVDALSSATYGDIVYVEDDAEIDLTGYIANTSYNALFITAGVTLASGRGNNGSEGGLIYTTDQWDDMYRVAMLGTGGDDIRITGLRIQGPSGWNAERATNDKYAIGIRCSRTGTGGSHKNIEVDNCEIYNWTMAGVYAMYGEGVDIHHNFIHTNIGTGYQYGIWFGGIYATSAEWVAEAEANLFDCNRHDIGSAIHWKWAARYNIFGPHQSQQILDRHPGASIDTWIENNWCQAYSDGQIEVRIAFNSDGGGTVYYNNNWTHREYVGPSAWDVAHTVIYGYPPNITVDAADNTMDFENYEGVYQPVAASTVTYLSDLYTVSFDSSSSYDPEGLDIVAHQWWFGDGSGTQGVVSYEDNPTYTYTDPGEYEVIHWAYNEYGVAGYESTTVTIRPEEGGYWLSAWIRDDCSEYIPEGYGVKQILIDDEVVWSDDVIGDEGGWEHVVVDISNYVTAGTGIKLAFALAYGGSGYLASMVVDNVHIFGGDVVNGQMVQHFTGPDAWVMVDPDGSSGDWQSLISILSGRLSSDGLYIKSTSSSAGTGGAYQYVPIGRALAPVVLDDFESGDGTGGENWDANWVLTGSAAVTSSGTPFDGTYHLLLTGSSAVASRAVDLSDMGAVGYDDVTLSFEYKADSFESGEEVSVEIYDGAQWQEVMVIEDGDDDGEYHLASIDLSGYSLTDDFEVRFTASLADAGDFFYIDDLMIA